MIMSALIAQCRREYGDPVRSSMAQKAADGASTLFALGKFPIVETSYSIKAGVSALTENAVSGFTINLDNGELTMKRTYVNGTAIVANFKYASWRDQNWLEAINQSIERMNGRGFFRQTVRDTTSFSTSANVRQYNMPSGTIEVYEVLESDNGTLSGNWRIPSVNWRYEQDQNVLVYGQFPASANKNAISYLRNMKTYGATSATLDVKNDWLEPIKKNAGAIYFRALAAHIATQGNANIDEGHFSFTNLRTQANDLANDFDKFAKEKKPVRPAIQIRSNMETGGPA